MKWISALFLLVGVLVAGALALPSFMDWNQYKGLALEKAQLFTGYEIELAGDLEVSILPSPRASIADVRIKVPDDAQDLLSLERLDVHLGLSGLLQGAIEVSAVTLQGAALYIARDASGDFNFMTPALQTLSAAQPSAQGQSVDVSFNAISIEDMRVVYADAGAAARYEVSGFNADITAQSLQGPFAAQGDVVVQDLPIAFDVKAGAIEGGAVPANVTLGLYDAALDFDGVIGFENGGDAQGELQIKAQDIGRVLGALNADAAEAFSGAADVKGFFTGNSEKASLKDMAVSLAGRQGMGSVDVVLQPLGVKADVKFDDVLDLDAFIGDRPASASSGTFDVAQVLPETLELPQLGDVDVTLSSAGMIYNAQVLRDVRVQLGKLDKGFAVDVAAGEIPGKGKVQMGADLIFAERSVSTASGMDLYSKPRLNWDVNGQTQNVAQSLQGLLGMDGVPVLRDAKIGLFDLKGHLDHAGLALDEGVVNLDDLKASLKGSLDVQSDGQKPVLRFDVMLGELDLDLFAGGSAQQSSTQPVAFPFDLDGKVNVNTLSGSQLPEGFKVSGVKLGVKGSADVLDIDAVFKTAGADINVSGPVRDAFAAPTTENIAVRIQHRDLGAFLKGLGVEAPRYAALSKPLDLAASVQLDGQKTSLKDLKGKVLGAELSGAAAFDMSGAKPMISGDMKFGRVELVGGGKVGASSAEKWSSAKLNTDWMHVLNMDLDIAAQSLEYEGWDMASPKLSMALKDGVLNLNELSAGLYDGRIALNGALLSPVAGQAVSLKGTANITNVNMQPLVQSFAGNSILKGQGKVSVQSDVNGSGSSMKALIGSMAGQGVISGSDIVIDGIDVNRFVRALSDESKPGDSLLHLWKGAGRGGQSAFETLDGAFTIENGVIRLGRMALDGQRSAIESSGTVDLPAWRLDTAHKMSVKDRTDVPPFTVKIAGPLDNPGQTFAQGAINDYLQRKITRKLGQVIGDKVDGDLGRVLGGILGAPSQPQQAPAPANDNAAPQQQQQAPQQVTPEDAVKGLLRGLLQ